MKAIQNAETNQTFIVQDDASKMLEELKAAGVKIGRTSLMELLSSKREVVVGFKLVEVEVTGDDTNAGDDNGGDQGNDTSGVNEGGGNQSDPTGDSQASNNDDHPMRRETDKQDDKPQAAGDQQPAEPKPAAANPAPTNSGATRKAFKSVEPKGKIKPVRSGTKIAKGLELLLKGTTQKELEETDGGVSDDVFDFVNRRVTKRGYGVKVEGDSIKLVLPEGTTKITYSNAAEGTAEEQAPAAKPIEEVKKETGDQPQDDQKSTPAPDDQPQDEPAAADQQ